jgi:alcohol dehydrogenase
LDKYARASEVLCEQRHRSRESAWQALLDRLHDWTERMQLPRLRQYGVSESDFDKIIANSRGNSMKTNPIRLEDREIRAILSARL